MGADHDLELSHALGPPANCNCHDPVTFGHQGRRCPKSMAFALDDLDCFLLYQRDNETRNHWYAEQADERQKLGIKPEPDSGERRLSLVRRLRYGLLRVFHSVFA